jgi:restriction system protein
MPHGYHRKSDSGLSEAISLLAFLVFLGLVGNVLTAHTLRDRLIAVAWIALFIIAACLVIIRIRQSRLSKLRALGMVDTDKMSGIDFEKYVAEILKSQGYDPVTLTEYFDWGVDITAVKDGVRYGMQVKRYKGLVKAEAVRQVVVALNKYHCQRAIVVTNSVFSRQAKVLAESNSCILVDRDTLAGWILAFQKNGERAVAHVHTF